MKSFFVTLGFLFGFVFFAHGFPDVVYRIEADAGRSSDFVTICRVSASNYSGESLDGKTLGFEALAIENGNVVQRERGRFSGIVRNGETAETLIGFNGAFRIFDVQSATGSSRSSRARSGGKSAGGRKSAAKSSPKKPSSRKTKKKAN